MARFKHTIKRGKGGCRASALMMILLAAVAASGTAVFGQTAEQRTFGSPEEALKALVETVQADDMQGVLAILGPGGKEIVSSGDEIADKAARTRFVKAHEERVHVIREAEDRVSVILGNDEWPFPIPIVKTGQGWAFDAEAAKEEILNRRIGSNELDAVQVCLAYVDAQREYHAVDWDGNGVIEYAQQIISDPGTRNGLYWEVKEGEAFSPLGPLLADAVWEVYTSREPGDEPRPYHGYYYRILKGQGSNAPDGAYSYVINGHMVAGFALIAWPAEYGNSGIMTFIVNQNGIVHERDLGPNTGEIVEFITQFDPNDNWRRAR